MLLHKRVSVLPQVPQKEAVWRKGAVVDEELKAGLVFLKAVRSLVAAVLKEKGSRGPITQLSAQVRSTDEYSASGRLHLTCPDCAVCQSPALESLWQQCCSDCALVRSVCCDAVVLLVDQGHADLQHILNGALNLLPSAR